MLGETGLVLEPIEEAEELVGGLGGHETAGREDAFVGDEERDEVHAPVLVRLEVARVPH